MPTVLEGLLVKDPQLCLADVLALW